MLLDSNKNNRLLELQDIVKELSDETGVPYKELEEICKLSLEYTKRLTEDKDTLSILVPELGTLYYSERFGEFYKTRTESFTERTKERKKKQNEFYTYRTNLIEKKEKENNIKKSYHRRKPLLYKFKNIYKKLYGKIVKGGATLGYQELWSKFSEIQNKIQNG
jgi:hypothetical protein